MPAPGLLLRRLALAGDYADLDWTDPANDPPASARPFIATATSALFDIIGKVDTTETAVQADVGAMVVDAWIAYEDPTILRASGKPAIVRGLAVTETTGSTLSTRIRLLTTNLRKGAVCRIHLALTTVTVTALDVLIVEGGRPL